MVLKGRFAPSHALEIALFAGVPLRTVFDEQGSRVLQTAAAEDTYLRN